MGWATLHWIASRCCFMVRHDLGHVTPMARLSGCVGPLTMSYNAIQQLYATGAYTWTSASGEKRK